MSDSRPQVEKHQDLPHECLSARDCHPPLPSPGPRLHVTAVTFGSNNNSPAGEQKEEFISQLQLGGCEI